MDRMWLECAFRYFCSCVTHIGNSAKRFHWLVPRLLPPFGEKWPAKQGANYSMIRWSMKRGWVALEEKNFPVLYLINQKAWRVQISSCLLFFNKTKARKNCSHFRKRLFFLFTNSLRWTGRLIRNRTIKQRSLNIKFTKHHLTELFYSTLNSKTKKKNREENEADETFAGSCGAHHLHYHQWLAGKHEKKHKISSMRRGGSMIQLFRLSFIL